MPISDKFTLNSFARISLILSFVTILVTGFALNYDTFITIYFYLFGKLKLLTRRVIRILKGIFANA